MNRFATVLLGLLLIASVGGFAAPGLIRGIQPTHAAPPEVPALDYGLPNPGSTIARSEAGPMTDSDQLIAAEVLLRPASGAAITGDTIITASTIATYRPSPETSQSVSQFFRDQGFEVSPIGGVSFTIQGTRARFAQLFKTSLTGDPASGMRAVPNAATTSEELPLTALPETIAQLVVAVTFAPPPDFGPTQFGP